MTVRYYNHWATWTKLTEWRLHMCTTCKVYTCISKNLRINLLLLTLACGFARYPIFANSISICIPKTIFSQTPWLPATWNPQYKINDYKVGITNGHARTYFMIKKKHVCVSIRLYKHKCPFSNFLNITQ